MNLLAILTIALAEVIVLAQSPKVVYATYVGESPMNKIFQPLAVDAAGFAYVSGVGCPVGGATSNAFLTKLNQSGTAAVWVMCLPMSNVYGIAIDGAGSVYVVGENAPDAIPTCFFENIIRLIGG